MMNDFIIETVDALREIYRNPKVATLFLVSGMDVTFRSAVTQNSLRILKFLSLWKLTVKNLIRPLLFGSKKLSSIVVKP